MKARDNPFAMDRIEALFEFEPSWCDSDWDNIWQRWRDLDYRAAIIGPHGSGKTTFLDSLNDQLSIRSNKAHRIFLNQQNRNLSLEQWQQLERMVAGPNDALTVILLDGAEQLSWRSWRRFHSLIVKNPKLRAIVTQHRANRWRWPTLLTTKTSPDLLVHLIKKLSLEFSAEQSETQINQLFARHKGNLREALWECYDLAPTSLGVVRK